MFMGILQGCLSVCVLHVRLLPTKARKRHQITWNWSYSCLCPMWVVGTQFRSSVRAESAGNPRAPLQPPLFSGFVWFVVLLVVMVLQFELRAPCLVGK